MKILGLILLFIYMLSAILYHIKDDYEKATYYLIWALIFILLILKFQI